MTAKLLPLDIEYAPDLVYAYQRFKVNVAPVQVVNRGFIMCVSALKVATNEKVELSIHDFVSEKMLKEGLSAWRHGEETNLDFHLIAALRALLDDADVIIGHNVDRYDLKKINTRMLRQGIQPPSNYKIVDTLKIAKNRFNFQSNSLQEISIQLGIGEKLKNGGQEMWNACLRGELEAWEQMMAYCTQDVALTWEVYKAMRGWHKSHPNLALYGEDITEVSCGVCGSYSMYKNGLEKTAVSVFQRWRCKDCGKEYRERKNKLNAKQNSLVLNNVR